MSIITGPKIEGYRDISAAFQNAMTLWVKHDTYVFTRNIVLQRIYWFITKMQQPNLGHLIMVVVNLKFRMKPQSFDSQKMLLVNGGKVNKTTSRNPSKQLIIVNGGNGEFFIWTWSYLFSPSHCIRCGLEVRPELDLLQWYNRFKPVQNKFLSCGFEVPFFLSLASKQKFTV